MTRIHRSIFFFLLVAATAAAQPTINSLSSTATRSGRVLIEGSGFGTAQGTAHVEIGGVVAPFTRWSDTLIAAYVPETAPTGTVSVQVFTSSGASSGTMPLGVTLRDLPGQVRWRFQADADAIRSRPALASDGTVYAIDAGGHLYALAPDGGLIWIFNLGGAGPGNVSVGPDGTIYTGNSVAIFALAPNGALKWKFDQSALILLGPNVGPDGNIYAVSTEGAGVISLTPQGALRWAVPETFSRPVVTLQEIVFAPAPQSQLYFHANDHLISFRLDGTPVFNYADGVPLGDNQPAVSPDGSLYTNLFGASGLTLGKFNETGSLVWQVFNKVPASTTFMSTPDAGSDNNVYDGRNLSSLYSFNPGSSVRWQYNDPGILFQPIVSPVNDLVFVGGVVNYGQPGFFAAVSNTGVLLWKVSLPVENSLFVVPVSRARFTPEGQTAYIGTSIAGQTANEYSYLYSVQTGSAPAAGKPATLSSFSLSPSAVVGGNTSKGTVTLSAPAPSGGAAIALTSSNSAVAKVPASVTVSAGGTSASFTATTSSVTAATGVQLNAAYSGAIVSAALTVQPTVVSPPPPSSPSLTLLSLSPSSVRGTASSQGTITLSGAAPTGGLLIKLSGSNTSAATVPASVTVAAGASSAVFTVQTKRVRTSTSVTISASGGTVTKQATLVVKR